MNIKSILDIFNSYSFSTLIIAIIILIFLSLEAINAWDLFRTPFRSWLVKRDNKKEQERCQEDRLKNVEKSLKDIRDLLAKMDEQIDILTQSDKDGIKAYLTDKHSYYFYEKKWIDNYNLDCIERRYVHYKRAGGNSFVDHLMEELRELPTQPPECNIKENKE